MSKLSWYQDVRIRAIETIAYWRGRINTRDLTEIFGISRVAAQGDIHKYLAQAPGNLIYRGSEKAYFATSIFECQLTSGHFEELIALDSEHCEYVNKPLFEINPDHARPLIHAIRKGTGIAVTYRSMEHPDGTERVLFPHTMVYSGFRWHTRAWCCERKDFRDFNLSRIRQVEPYSENAPSVSAPSKDILWNTMVDIQLKANPGLSEQECLLIESEFGMRNRQLKITTRAALVMYTLQAYQVEPDATDNIYKQRLILANPDEMTPYFW